jgi:hypothetical protein
MKVQAPIEVELKSAVEKSPDYVHNFLLSITGLTLTLIGIRRCCFMKGNSGAILVEIPCLDL